MNFKYWNEPDLDNDKSEQRNRFQHGGSVPSFDLKDLTNLLIQFGISEINWLFYPVNISLIFNRLYVPFK